MKARTLTTAVAVALSLVAGALTLVASEPVAVTAQAADVPKEQRFSIMCQPVFQAPEDPFLDPIGTDNDHVHQFFGTTGIRTWPNDPVDKEAGMRGVPTSCGFEGDTASYWVPMFMDRNGNMIEPTQVLVYYRHNRDEQVVPHPEGMLLKSFDVEWGCLDSDNFANPPDCSNREIRMRVIFKPQTIGNAVTPRIAMNVRFDTMQGQGGHIMGGASGEHGNFFNTWDQAAYTGLINLCLTPEGVASQTKAEWNDNCVKVGGDGQVPPVVSPSPGPSPTNSPEPSSSPSPGLPPDDEMVTVCHRSGSPNSPYVIKEVPADDLRHLDHTGPIGLTVEDYQAIVAATGPNSWGDIVPPFVSGGQEFPGLNWTEQGQAIYANANINPDGCVLPPPPPPDPYEAPLQAVQDCLVLEAGGLEKLDCILDVLRPLLRVSQL